MTGLPDFIVIGSQKSGTSSLYASLAKHQNIVMANRSEVEYFSYDLRYSAGIDYYKSHFPANAPGIVVGEVSPGYMINELCAERMRQVLPKVKLIAVLRHPVDRAYSAWLMQVSKGSESLGFEKALSQNPIYLQHSLYGKQLRRYLKFYPREQICILFFEDLISNPHDLISQVLDFIGLDKNHNISLFKENTGGQPRFKIVTDFLSLMLNLKKNLLRSKYGKMIFSRWLDDVSRRIRNVIAELNRKGTSSSNTALSPELRMRLCSHFYKDILLLEETFNISAKEKWKMDQDGRGQ
ncbi:MAG: sulfotransferase [Pseudomonadota bacterium]|nr:sulfotransferase [Pseudomonadota bacterium]MDP2351053.1 sulfotransferase [Pseudomonadota bacterium]